MRYFILGPLEVRDASLGHGRQRLLLAVLLLHRNEVLSSERLIEALWGEAAPPSAAGSLHNLVSALRKALGNGALVTHGHGYALTVAPGELDTDEFEALSARGRAALADGDAGEAAELLREALALWRGPALGELAYDLPAAAARLEDLKLAAVEDRIDADLALGRDTALVAELAELVERHPERERLRGQQMLALYRCDRQADALAAYQDYRRRLAAELGLAPAPALRALEQAILEHDSALGAPTARFRTPRPPRRPVVAAGAAIALVVLVAVLARDGPSGAVRPESVRVAGDALAVIDPATNRVTASYPVGATPISASVGGGAAWTVSADAQTISRIDLRDRTTRTFGTGSIPLEVAAASNALWLLAADAAGANGPFAGSPALLSRIDPETTGVAQSTALVPREGPGTRLPPGLIAVGRDSVWMIGRDGRLLQADRRSGAARTVPRLKALSVATGGDQVWVVADTVKEMQPNLLRLDPRDGRVLDEVLVPWASVAGLAVGAGAVWISDPYAGAVWRVDPGPRAMQQTVAAELGVDSVAADGHSVWASNSVTGTVSRIDPATNRVTATVAIGGTPRSVALGAGRVWVAVAGGDRNAAAALPSGATLRPLVNEGCTKPLTARGAPPDLLIAADLPRQGRFTSTSLPVAAAIAHVLRAHHFRAGRFRLALQTCDDSLAQSGQPDEGKCLANAHAYADNPAVIGVVGPIHSFCAEAMLPTLNSAPAGPVSVVSPTNTWTLLTRGSPMQLSKLYPTGQRGYARVYPADEDVMAATALATTQLGATSVYYLYDWPDKPWRHYFRTAARRIDLRIAGMKRWNADADNFRALARRVRNSGAQAVVVDGGVYAHVGRVLRDVRRTLGPNFPVLATEDALPIVQLFDEAGAAARGVHIVVGGRQPQRLDAAGRRFVREFGATQPGGRVGQFDVYAAAATEVLLDAIARSDGTRQSVANALATTRLPAGPIGPIALDRQGDPTVTHATVVRAEHGGSPFYINGTEGGEIERVITIRAGGA